MQKIEIHERYSSIEICGECLEISANGKRDIDYDLLERYERAQALEGGEPCAELYDSEGEFTYTEFSRTPCGFCRSTMAGSRYPARLIRLRPSITDDVWELTEKAPRYAEDIASLWSWSLNYDSPTPWQIFLMLIGHPTAGEVALLNQRRVGQPFGYVAGDCMALDYLGDALNEYSERPSECMEYVDVLMSARGYAEAMSHARAGR